MAPKAVKRPAAKTAAPQAKRRVSGCSGSGSVDWHSLGVVTDEPFQLEGFIREVWQLGGYEVEPSAKETVVASSICSGSNSFGYSLEAMLRVAGSSCCGIPPRSASLKLLASSSS